MLSGPAPLPMPEVLVPVESATPLAEPTASRPCAACGETLGGRYCHGCGERAVGPEDESLAAFLREQFQEVTSADGRLWRSVRALFVPGKLTEEYFAGRRSLYVRPVRLFLIVNVLFFLWVSVVGGRIFLGNPALYRGVEVFERPMAEAAAEAGVTDEAFDAAFAQRAQTLAPTLIAVFVPVYALLIALLLLGTRRPLVRHIVLATHTVAAFMVLFMSVTALLAAPVFAAVWVTDNVPYDLDDAVIVPTVLVAWSAYLVVGVRRVYRLPWWGAVLSGTTLATGGTLVALEAYRWTLLYTTLWTLDIPA